MVRRKESLTVGLKPLTRHAEITEAAHGAQRIESISLEIKDRLIRRNDILEIARFKMRPNVSLNNIKCIGEGGSWIHENAIQFMSIPIYDNYEITLNIGFPEDLSKWDDFDYVLVLDESFGQPYTPFYSFMNRPWRIKIGSALSTIIQNYNEEMRNLPFLEEIK